MAHSFPGESRIAAPEERRRVSVSKLRILFVSSGLSIGGAEMMLCHLGAALRARGAAVGVISLTPAGPLMERLLASHVDVWCLNMPRGRPGLRGAFRAAALARRFRPDILQGWMYHGNLAATLIKHLASRRSRLVWSLHSLMSSEKPSRNVVNRICAKLSHFSPRRVICVSSRAIAVHAAAGYDIKKFVHIPNGIDTDRFRSSPAVRLSVRSELGLSDADQLVGHLGRFDPAKDYECLLQSAHRVIRAVPQAKFVLCGTGLTGGNQELHQWAADPETRRACLFLGPRSDPERILSALDLFLLSSRSEAFPLALLEAMSTALPCVATDVGDCKAILGDAGQTVPPGDPQALAEACIRSLRLAPEQRCELGASARDRVIKRFGLDYCVEAHAALYSRLLSGTGSDDSLVNGQALEARC